jgi:hypothetical protein
VQTRPDPENLLRTVAGYLADLQGRVDGGDRHQLRVAVHLLGIAERQLRLGAEVDGREQRAYASLLGMDGSLHDLNRELCRRIGAGDFDDRFDEVLGVIADGVEQQLRIAAPGKAS